MSKNQEAQHFEKLQKVKYLKIVGKILPLFFKFPQGRIPLILNFEFLNIGTFNKRLMFAIVKRADE